MTSSHRCNKREIKPRKKSYYSRNLYKSNSFGNYLHYTGKHSFSLMNKTKKEIINEWVKVEKEIIYLVYLSGSFVYLDKYCETKKKEKMFCSYNLNINYLFQKLKYKANGNMRINSIVLLTKNLYKTEKEKNTQIINSKNQSTKDISSALISENNVLKKIIDFKFSTKNYCNYYPKHNEMKEIADKKPIHFPMECFLGVNRFHNEIGKKEFLNLNERNIFKSNNNSYKIIDKKDHILLNHLCQFKTKNKNINSITIRYRNKNSTFIYYK